MAGAGGRLLFFVGFVGAVLARDRDRGQKHSGSPGSRPVGSARQAARRSKSQWRKQPGGDASRDAAAPIEATGVRQKGARLGRAVAVHQVSMPECQNDVLAPLGVTPGRDDAAYLSYQSRQATTASTPLQPAAQS